jgi:putative FmdB family regulatory protein
MPIYEYKCPKCGEFEVTQRITENALKKCPTCKSKVERQLSRTSFILKGTGWYVTDYAKKPSGEAAAKADNGKAETTKSESTTSDSSKSDTSSKADSSSSSANGSNAAASAPAAPAKSKSEKSTASKSAD